MKYSNMALTHISYVGIQFVFIDHLIIHTSSNLIAGTYRITKNKRLLTQILPDYTFKCKPNIEFYFS